MKTKLLRKFRARFDYAFAATKELFVITEETIDIEVILLFDKKIGKEKIVSSLSNSYIYSSFHDLMFKLFSVKQSRKRRKLLEKKRIKDNHKRWKDEF